MQLYSKSIECYYDDCHGTVFTIAFDEVRELKISIFDMSFVECLYAECFYVDCYNECIIIFIFKIPYAECLFAKCHYDDCHGTVF